MAERIESESTMGVFASRWVAPVFVGLGVLLLPWVIWLTYSLPTSEQARHWRLAWVGFDSALAVLLILVGVAAVKRSFWIEGVAAATATLLLTDAWFDLLTAKPGRELTIAGISAGVCELPLALACFWIARSAERFFVRTDTLRG